MPIHAELDVCIQAAASVIVDLQIARQHEQVSLVVQEAYELLSDPTKKGKYDQSGFGPQQSAGYQTRVCNCHSSVNFIHCIYTVQRYGLNVLPLLIWGLLFMPSCLGGQCMFTLVVDVDALSQLHAMQRFCAHQYACNCDSAAWHILMPLTLLTILCCPVMYKSCCNKCTPWVVHNSHIAAYVQEY